MSALALVRVLQLASQALPIGGYSHSQGLESAIEHRVVTDEKTVLRWITDVLSFSMMGFEIPNLVALCAAWAEHDAGRVGQLNEEFVATRETAELRAASLQMGHSMRVLLYLLPDLPLRTVDMLRSVESPGLPCVWSAAAGAWAVPPLDAAVAYAWAWAENQVLVAIKTLPMGQSAGQRILTSLGATIARDVPRAADRAPSNFTPALAILCARHETQYSRLFRS